MTSFRSDVSAVVGNPMGGPSFEVVEIGRATARIGAGRRALVLGSGSGRNALYLASEGISTTGIEHDRDQVTKAIQAQAASGVAYNVEESLVQDFAPDGPYDLCLALGILHFLPPRVASDVVGSLKAATVQGGLHVIALSHRRPGEHFVNSLSSQGHLNSFGPDDAVECYSDWDLLAHETYVKRDTHDGSSVEIHPIDKLVFSRPGGGQEGGVAVRSVPLESRRDQAEVGSALESLTLRSATIEDVRRLLGPEDVLARATTTRPQLGLMAPSPRPYEITIGFWGVMKGYFENGVLVGTARYLSHAFHRFSSPDLAEQS